MDLTTLIADIQAALDEGCRLAGIPTQAQTIAQLTTDLGTANGKVTALQTAIAGVRQRAQGRKDADAASVDGQADLDALAGL